MCERTSRFSDTQEQGSSSGLVSKTTLVIDILTLIHRPCLFRKLVLLASSQVAAGERGQLFRSALLQVFHEEVNCSGVGRNWLTKFGVRWLRLWLGLMRRGLSVEDIWLQAKKLIREFYFFYPGFLCR
ncbi:MAG: hypothetical protein ACYTX0_39915 [Nostoc sp.]